jgi:hypothetical protein
MSIAFVVRGSDVMGNTKLEIEPDELGRVLFECFVHKYGGECVVAGLAVCDTGLGLRAFLRQKEVHLESVPFR